MNELSEHSSLLPIVAHRGYAARFPENTRESLQAAITEGAAYVEFDVQLSADGVPFVLHDETFERTGGAPMRIFDLNAEAVAQQCAGEPGRFGMQFEDVRVPRLSTVIQDLMKSPDVTVFVELKHQSLNHFGIPRVVKAVLDCLEPILDRCVIISFEPDVLPEVRRQGSSRCGWVLPQWNSLTKMLAAELAPEYLFCDVNKLPPEPEPLWVGPWKWAVYEITDASLARNLMQRGVHLVETMEARAMITSLSNRDLK